MIQIHYFGTTYESDKAIRGEDFIVMYNANNEETKRFEQITHKDWLHISINGDWTNPADIPTDTERMQADLDFLTMENEYLEEQSEQYRADIDYCLMLLEEA